MGKTRVYELAQKLGLDNKALLDRLQAAGVDGKTHMSVLEEEDLRKFEAAQTPVVEKIEEERITPGIIRRRRKEVAPPVALESAPETAAEEEPAAPAEIAAPTAVESDSQAPAPAVETAPVVAPEPAPAAEIEKPKDKEAVAKEPAPAKPVVPAEPKVERVTASRAKILGRVELPQEAPRGGNRPETGRPGRQERPGTPRQERPGTARPERPGAARPERPSTTRPERPARPGAGPAPTLPAAGEPFVGKEARGGKKKKKGKGADYSEAPAEAGRRRGRREVFEPDRDGGKLRRGKRAPKMQKKTEVTVSKAIKRIIRISDVITVGELAKRMGVKANDLIKELMRQGSMVTINHPLDYDTAAILASEFNYEVENVAFDEETILDHASLKNR